jgi:hypothetical protein
MESVRKVANFAILEDLVSTLIFAGLQGLSETHCLCYESDFNQLAVLQPFPPFELELALANL